MKRAYERALEDGHSGPLTNRLFRDALSAGKHAELTAQALELVEDEAKRFERWLTILELLPTVRALRRRGDDIVTQLLEENERRWEGLSSADRERVEMLARAAAGRLLDEPTRWLKRAESKDLPVPREAFGLDDEAGGGEARVAV